MAKRYIDVDTLLNKLHIAGEKEGAKADDMAKRGIGDACIKYNHGQYCYIDAQEIVKTIPTADVEEVVRCRDCKHRRKTAFRSYCMPVYGLKQITDLNSFCSYGERRTDNDL